MLQCLHVICKAKHETHGSSGGRTVPPLTYHYRRYPPSCYSQSIVWVGPCRAPCGIAPVGRVVVCGASLFGTERRQDSPSISRNHVAEIMALGRGIRDIIALKAARICNAPPRRHTIFRRSAAQAGSEVWRLSAFFWRASTSALSERRTAGQSSNPARVSS